MLWSQRSVVLVAAVSAVIFSALISARSSYDGKDLGAQQYYNEQNGNYYPNPRQEVSIPFARPPSLLKRVVNAIKRLLLIPERIRRQGFVGALSGLGPVAVAGVATAGVFRNEIADIVEDLTNPTTTTTTAATTKADPCKGVTCDSASGYSPVSNLGICQCLCGSGTSAFGITLPSTVNVCVSGTAKCGTLTSNTAACSTSTIPKCLSSMGGTLTLGGTASCQCTQESSDCMAASSKTTTPVCCDGSGDCKSANYGTCVACSNKDTAVTQGTGSAQGTCPTTNLKCCSDGSCKEKCA